MRTLTPHEKRTVRFGAAAIVIYLLLFGGFQVWKYFAKSRAEYQKLVIQADALKGEVRLYDDRVLVAKKLMESLRLDPAKLSRTSVVAGSRSGPSANLPRARRAKNWPRCRWRALDRSRL